ncbi:hypothetical protein AAMO2058_001170900 [Amorphochlora amoebiformis]
MSCRVTIAQSGRVTYCDKTLSSPRTKRDFSPCHVSDQCPRMAHVLVILMGFLLAWGCYGLSNRTVLVGNLPSKVSQVALKKWLSKSGKIASISVRFGGKSGGTSDAVVRFRNKFSALNAVESLNGTLCPRSIGRDIVAKVSWYHLPEQLLRSRKNALQGESFSLSGVNFAITGTLNRTHITNFITANKGFVSNVLHRKVHYLISDQTAALGNTQRVRKAKQWRTPIVSRQFVYDCVSHGMLLNPRAYNPKSLIYIHI